MMTNTINTSQIEFWDKNFFVLNVFCIPCTFFLIVHPQQADMVSRCAYLMNQLTREVFAIQDSGHNAFVHNYDTVGHTP